MCAKEKRKCPKCGKIIPRQNLKYCSKECYRPKRENKRCKFCGKVFNKPGNTIYCSMECYHQAQLGKPSPLYDKRTIICDTCGKSFLVHPNQVGKTRFCGDDCFYKWLKGSHWAPGEERACPVCGKWFFVLQSDINNPKQRSGIYCSKKCHNEAKIGQISKLKKPRIECTCMNCGKKFPKLACQIKIGRGKFCSRSCSAAYYFKVACKSPTSIEKPIIEELDKRNIKYEFQYSLNGYVLDFAFPEAKFAVEADGKYWHNLDNVKKKDAKKDRLLTKWGWHILRLDEDVINANASICVDIITNYLQGTKINQHPRVLRAKIHSSKNNNPSI